MIRKLSRIALLIILGASLLACDPQPLKIEIDGDSSLSFNAPGEEHYVHAIVYDREGNAIVKPKLRYYSIDSKIAEVTPEGIIKPKSDGRTRVVVRSGYSQ